MTYKEISSKDLGVTLDASFHLIGTFNYKIFDFSHIQVNENNLEHTAMLLRGLSSWSSSINGYKELINKCVKVCVEQNVDEHDLLFGMIPKDNIEILSEKGYKFIRNLINEFLFERLNPVTLLMMERKLNEALSKNPTLVCYNMPIFRFRLSQEDSFILKIEILDSDSVILCKLFVGN